MLAVSTVIALAMAAMTIERFVKRAIRISEQEPGVASNHSRLGMYVRRRVGWTKASLAVADILPQNGAAAGQPNLYPRAPKMAGETASLLETVQVPGI